MWPLIAAAGGSKVLDTFANTWQQDRQNRFNKIEASKNRAFQERMANSQWQRTVADMQAAGINPAVAYSQGPNMAPSGSAASAGGASPGPDTLSSVLALRGQQKQLELMDKQIKKTTAEAGTAEAEETYRRALNILLGVKERDGSLGIALSGGGGLLDRQLRAGINAQESAASSAQANARATNNAAELSGVSVELVRGLGEKYPALKPFLPFLLKYIGGR